MGLIYKFQTGNKIDKTLVAKNKVKELELKMKKTVEPLSMKKTVEPFLRIKRTVKNI